MTSDELIRKKNIDELRVYFDADEYTPNIASTGLVDVVTSFMKDYPVYVATIEGHTDERDTREYNLSLGERRASKVKDMMIECGVHPNRIKRSATVKSAQKIAAIRVQILGEEIVEWYLF
jgi:outer membrane protein OmpA-like peptidoglycan-associated protein